jgi:AcrR family transcriptional regulator
MKKNTKKRVSKNQWLELALEVLSKEGVSAVKIERLARKLQVSKSGFYWHFRDRQNLLEQLLDYWAYEYTSVIPQNQVLRSVDPKSRLYQVMQIIQDYNLAKYDLAIRAWAEHDTLAAEAVEKVYQQRRDYIRKAFNELGFRGDELEMRTGLFLCYHTWESSMIGENPKRNLNKLLNLRHRMLTE